MRDTIKDIVSSISQQSLRFGMDVGSAPDLDKFTDKIINAFESEACKTCIKKPENNESHITEIRAYARSTAKSFSKDTKVKFQIKEPHISAFEVEA